MNTIPKGLVDQWRNDVYQTAAEKYYHVAQRAAEWGKEQFKKELLAMDMEPVGVVDGEERGYCSWGHTVNWGHNGHLPKGTRFFSEEQLVAARLQGAEEECQKWEADYRAKCNELELVHSAHDKRIAELESENERLAKAWEAKAASEVKAIASEREVWNERETLRQCIAELEERLRGQAPQGGPYKDSTPELHVGDSSFESWYETYPRQGISKQVARDAYAAGMGDSLVTRAKPSPEAEQEPVQQIEGRK